MFNKRFVLLFLPGGLLLYCAIEIQKTLYKYNFNTSQIRDGWLNRRVVDEPDGHGLPVVARLVLPDEILGLDEDFEVENDAENAQAQVPGEDIVDVSQIDGAGVDGEVAGPKRAGDNDERQERGQGEQPNHSANGDAFLVPFVANDGQVAIECGQRQADQQDGVVDGS